MVKNSFFRLIFMKNETLEKFCIQIPCRFKDILKKFNQNLNGIVFVVDKKKN